MKRVYTNHDQVLHLWANQTQSDARCRNVFYRGISCYSYSSRYELGRLVQYNGVTVAMVNDSGWSNTTNKHIHSAWHAVAHIPRLKSHELGDVKGALLRRQGELVDMLFNHFRGLKFWTEYGWNNEYSPRQSVNEFNKICQTLKHPEFELEINSEYIQAFNEHVQARLAKQAVAKTLKHEKMLKQAAVEIPAWRAGGPITHAVRDLPLQLLRIKGKEVETSRGASVPLTHALRLLKMVETGKAKSGIKVGDFEVSDVHDETIEIGCHTIALSEARAVLSSAKPTLSLVV